MKLVPAPSRIILLIEERIVADKCYKRYDTVVEWEDLFFDYGGCEVRYEGLIYRINDEIADQLYFKFRDQQNIQRLQNLDEL